jgi:hypothetical protein
MNQKYENKSQTSGRMLLACCLALKQVNTGVLSLRAEQAEPYAILALGLGLNICV